MDITDRFLKYVSFPTTSDESSNTVPSTEKQLDLGEHLKNELIKTGLEQVKLDEKGYVFGFLPPTEDMKNERAIGFIAHMDTSASVSGENIKPRVITYEGGDIPLGNNEIITEALFPFLKNYKGKKLIVTDGTTLLGADDKAGIAEIISACEYFSENPQISHRGVAVAFTPDEEIGRGADHFDFSSFHASFAYTVDGGELGEIEYENFNAAAVKVTVKGHNIHPGSAKNRMKNAVLMGTEFISMLPAWESPAHTEDYEGFYHVCDFKGDESDASINMLIRDHDRDKFEKRKLFIRNLTDYLNEKYGEGTFSLSIKDSYYNMKEKLLPHMWLIDDAVKAMKKHGAEPNIIPIRGGTDGARLSYEGLPCPNLSTGGAGFHGVHELVCVESMETMVKVICELCR